MAPRFEDMARGYRALWAKCAVTPERRDAVDRTAKTVIANRASYAAAARATSVPWWWIGVVHYRESSFSWARSLAQGDPWNKRSVHVPAGRGPFTSWSEAAIDALTLHALDRVADWGDIARVLYELERWNGWGYAGKGVNSPYLWAATNLQQSGKYVADHVWDPRAVDTQLGCAAILLRLAVLDQSVARDLAAAPKSTSGPARAPAPSPAPTPRPPAQPGRSLTHWLRDFITGIFKP